MYLDSSDLGISSFGDDATSPYTTDLSASGLSSDLGSLDSSTLDGLSADDSTSAPYSADTFASSISSDATSTPLVAPSVPDVSSVPSVASASGSDTSNVDQIAPSTAPSATAADDAALTGLNASTTSASGNWLSDLGGFASSVGEGAWGFTKGVGEGAWDGVQGIVQGAVAIGSEGYALATDSQARAQAAGTLGKFATSAADAATTVATDPGKALDSVGNAASDAWNRLSTAYSNAAANGNGAEFVGNIVGQGAVLLGTLAIPGAEAGALADGARVGELADGVRAADLADGARAAELADGARAPGISGGSGSGAVSEGSDIGAVSGRQFDLSSAGGPLEALTTDGVAVTPDGVSSVVDHLGRFGTDDAPLGSSSNDFMVDRLKGIADGALEPTQTDLNFYTHELREQQRYTNLGWAQGMPADADAAWKLWNDTHTATLEEYGLSGDADLYDPSLLNSAGKLKEFHGE